MSPSANTPATFVSSRLLVLINPWASVRIPAAPRFSVSEFGTRPVATSKCEPSIVSLRSPLLTSRRIFSTSSATSRSSRASNCGPDSTTVTRLPKRRNICPNSSPTYPPPSTSSCAGTESSSMIDLLSRNGTWSSPSSAGRAARVPAFSCINKDLVCHQRPLAAIVPAYRQCLRPPETCRAENQAEVRGLLDPRLIAFPKTLHNLALPLPHPLQVDRDWPSLHAIIRAPPCQIGHARARHHGFGRRASFVHAGAADVLAFHQGRAHAGFRQGPAQWRPRLARPHHDCVIPFPSIHGKPPPGSRQIR